MAPALRHAPPPRRRPRVEPLVTARQLVPGAWRGCEGTSRAISTGTGASQGWHPFRTGRGSMRLPHDNRVLSALRLRILSPLTGYTRAHGRPPGTCWPRWSRTPPTTVPSTTSPVHARAGRAGSARPGGLRPYGCSTRPSAGGGDGVGALRGRARDRHVRPLARIENRGQPLVEAASIALRLRRPLLWTGWTTWCGSGRRPGSATC